MEESIKASAGRSRFRYRVAGLLEEERRVLLDIPTKGGVVYGKSMPSYEHCNTADLLDIVAYTYMLQTIVLGV